MADRVDRETGGFEAEFVLPLPQEYECPICQLAFRDPVQIEDCGHRFCQSCLQELKRRQGSPCLCPLDRKPFSSSKVFVDKAAQRAVLSLAVKCVNWKRKCDWTGDLIYAEDHMKTCAYEEVHCTNSECNEVMTRRNLQYHLVSKCRWRVVSCHFCADMYTYKDSKTHMKVCRRIPLECVNKCGAKDIPREELSFHLTECTLAVHPCYYLDIGCTFKVEGSHQCHADWCNYNEYCCGYDMCCDYLTDYWYLWLTMGLLFFFLILVCCWLRYHRQHSKESTEGRYVPLPGAFVKYGDEYYIPQQPPQVPFAREPPHFTETREFESQQYDSSRFYPPPYNFIERTPSAPPEGL